MPHFADDILKSDPDALDALRGMLRGAHTAPAAPSLAERFGRDARIATAPAGVVRKVRRRRQPAVAPG